MRLLHIAVIFFAGVQTLPAQLAKALDLNDRGNRASEQGKNEEAIGLYREALDIWRESGTAYDAHRAGTLLNLGIVVSATGNRTEAARVMEEALALHRKTLGDRDHRTITNINLLAANYLTIGKIEPAEALLDEVLPVLRELYPNDIQLARALETKANLLVSKGQFAEALPPAEEALTISIAVTGENSLDTALATSNVAEVHRTSGRNERALPLFRRARVLYAKAVGPAHPRVAALLSQEGLILLEDGKVSMADQSMTQALSLLQEHCPKCSFEIANAENNLAMVRWTQKRYPEADELLTHVLSLRERYTQTPGLELASTMRLLAAVRKKEKLYDDAARLVQRADVILGYR